MKPKNRFPASKHRDEAHINIQEEEEEDEKKKTNKNLTKAIFVLWMLS